MNILIAIEICKSNIKKLLEFSTSTTLLATKTDCLQYKLNKLLAITLILVITFLISSCSKLATKREIKDFMQQYFSSWSAKDMQTYQSLFHPDAIIHDVRKDGKVYTVSLLPFVESQTNSLNAPGFNLTEKADSIKIDIRNDFAHVRVHWTMFNNNIIRRTGYDFFTLKRTRPSNQDKKKSHKWQIMHLLYYTLIDFNNR